MDLQEYLKHLSSGQPILAGSELHQLMIQFSQEALRITEELNSAYHTPEEIRTLKST